MAQRTLSRMYDNYEDAKTVVHELEVPASHIVRSAWSPMRMRTDGPPALGHSGDDRWWRQPP